MLGRKKYAFVGEEEEEEQPTRSRRHGKMADEDEGGEDTFVDQFFSKRPEIQIQTKIQHSRKPSSRAAAAASSSTFVQPRLKYRAKPDLTSDEEDDDHRQDISTFSSSSSKPTAGEVRKRQHLAEKRFELLQLARDKERREHLEQLKHDRIQREEQKLKQKFWMGEILQGAFRSRDDRGGANGQQLVLRRDTLKETAREYAHGRHVFQAAFISHPGVKAGRFYLEPQGSKSTETNSHNTVLYLILERTGAEGVTIRVDKKFYEVFEGDSVLVPEGAIYAVINPSKTMGCTLLYMLVNSPLMAEENKEEVIEQEEAEAILTYDVMQQQQSVNKD